MLALPFLQSLFWEIAAIVGFAIGFGHERRASGTKSQNKATLPATALRLLGRPATNAEPADWGQLRTSDWRGHRRGVPLFDDDHRHGRQLHDLARHTRQ